MNTSAPKSLQELVTCDHYSGQWMNAKNYQDVLSPYTGATIGRVAMGNADDVAKIVAKAKAGSEIWKLTPIKERCGLLFKFRELVMRDIDRLANIAALEAGKTIAEAKAGIQKGLEVTEFAVSLQNAYMGHAMEVSRGVSCESRREPLGVVAGIAPFNFPAMVPMWMYPIAIALGNSFILKPSEKVPLTSHFMAEIFKQAGFPDGVFNLVNGGREVVEALIDHPEVKAVGFVGSTPVAKKVYQRATALGKRALTLGGAKNHLLVVPDADEKVTVKGVVDSFTGCAGQRCMAASLMIAVGDVDHLIEKIVAHAKGMKLCSDMGAIIDQNALKKIRDNIDAAEKDGAKIILDGRKQEAPSGMTNGNWIAPTIIDHAKPNMRCATEEIFGPVLTIVRVAKLEDAMKLEAMNQFGNATSVFTTSGSVARYVAEKATNGMIGVNIGVPVPREPFSFGGSKESKFGACDITGASALEFWSQWKKVTIKWDMQKDNNWMS